MVTLGLSKYTSFLSKFDFFYLFSALKLFSLLPSSCGYVQSVDNEIVLWEPKMKEHSPGEVSRLVLGILLAMNMLSDFVPRMHDGYEQ